jgi:outer membrane receptor protein involved in Fe transport
MGFAIARTGVHQLLLVTCVLAAVGSAASAQEATGRVRGRVTNSASGAPVPGAQVFIAGDRQGGLTGSDGTYLIAGVPAGARTVRVRALGYQVVEKPVTVLAGGTASLDFAVVSAPVSLDEVVVTGTAGQARKREVGNSIGQIKVADAPEVPSNVSNLLAGRVAGVVVGGGVGNAGGGQAIRLRGATSVSLTNQPLIYIDGVRTRSDEYPRNGIFTGATQRGANSNSSPLNDINPDDIDRIEVVKGAAAATLFGTDAAAGVIQIFTKRGSQGAAKWNAQVNTGVSDLQDFGTEAAPKLFMEPFLRTGGRLGSQMQVAGGGQNNTKYLLSAGADNIEGVLPNDLERKYNLRSNLDFVPARALNVSFNTSYANSLINNTPAGNNAQGITLNAFRRDRNYFGTANPDTIRRVLTQQLVSNIDRLILGATGTYTPFAAGSSRLTLGIDRAAVENRNVRPYGFPNAPLGVIQNQRWANTTLSVDWANNLEHTFGKSLRGTFSFGSQYVSSAVGDVVAYSERFPSPTEATVASGSLKNADENRQRVITGGVFVQSLIGLRDRYFLTVGARVDGNSAFGKDFGFQTYPKVSGSWVVSDEGFWSDRLGTLKLRAAYGQAGRAPGAFAAVQTWDAVGWGDQPAVRPSNLGNRDLGPERTSELELGFDQSAFSGRLNVDFTYFNAVTRDALFAVNAAPSEGFLNSVLRNVGQLEKSGLEVAVTGTLLDRPRFGLSTGLNLTTLRTNVASLGGAPPFSIGNFGWIQEGHPAPSLRGTLIRNADAVGAAPDTVANHLFGPSQPTRIVSGTVTVRTFRQITVALRGEYQGGAYINEDASYQALSRSVQWPTCFGAYDQIAAKQPITVREELTCRAANVRSTMFIFPADFFKLRDLTLTVPLGRLIPRTSSSSLVLSAQNFYRRNYGMPLFDPEMSGNDGFNANPRYISEQIPAPAMYMSSLRVSF